MPCLAVHLAVAKKYLENHKEENHDEFILGTIAPDTGLDNFNDYINGDNTDKNSRHFGYNYSTSDIVEYMKKKVGFKPFFDKNDINTSFLRAYDLEVPDLIKDTLSHKGTGSIKLLDVDTLYKFIDDMSSLDLYKEKEILKDD